MKPGICIMLFMLCASATQASAFAQSVDSLSCGGGIVLLGDMAPEVVRKCGEPTSTSQREQHVIDDTDFPGRRIKTTIVIDDWIFNFGRDRFQYRVLLKNGRVWKIESLDYGY